MRIPGLLLAEQALNYEAVRDPDALQRLVGEPVQRAFISRGDGRVFYGSEPELEGKWIGAVVNEQVVHEFRPNMGSSCLRQFAQDGSNYLSIVTPLRSGTLASRSNA